MRYTSARRRLGFILVLIIEVGLAPSHSALAAMINLEAGADGAVIHFSGPIEIGDAERFRDITVGVEKPTLVLNSLGGVVDESLEIGRLVRTEGYNTTVSEGAICASACGFIWLAGNQRTITGDGLVGFHAAYLSDGQQTISSTANALIGAYLSKLGFNDLTIMYVTQAAPQDMRWLAQQDAAFLGLEVSWNTPDQPDIAEPALTRAEIKEALLWDDAQRAYMRRFPQGFDVLVDEMYAAQREGENWEAVLLRSLFLRQEVRDSIGQLYSEASDELIEGASRAELALLKDLLISNPQLCASRLVATEEPIDGVAFVEIYKGITKSHFDALNAYHRKALLASPVPVRALTKKQKVLLTERARQLTTVVLNRFTASERSRLVTPNIKKDAELICRFAIRYSEVLLKEPKVLSALVRHHLEINSR